MIITLILKITISSIVIGLKNSYFPLAISLAKLLSGSFLLGSEEEEVVQQRNHVSKQNY